MCKFCLHCQGQLTAASNFVVAFRLVEVNHQIRFQPWDWSGFEMDVGLGDDV